MFRPWTRFKNTGNIVGYRTSAVPRHLKKHSIHFLSSRLSSYSELLKDGTSSPPKVVFSGIQPTGVPHLGNYLGAIANWKTLQSTMEKKSMYYCVVDLHSLTAGDTLDLRENTLQLTASLLSCGIDPSICVLYNQSKVSAHCELSWILTCITPMYSLHQMIQYKDKSTGRSDGGGAGLFSYPVLMAADILLYRATHVPVGEDQWQHLSLAKTLATRANRRWESNFFIEPQGLFTHSKKIMSLTNPEKKMSKSDPLTKSRIGLTDSKDEIMKKIRLAKTDSDSCISYEPERRPGASNLIDIYSGISNRSVEDIVLSCEGYNWGQFKQELVDVMVDKIVPIGDSINKWLDNRDELEKILERGAKEAEEVAISNLAEVKKVVGLV